jgi:hypothetical protein
MCARGKHEATRLALRSCRGRFAATVAIELGAILVIVAVGCWYNPDDGY